MVHHLLLLKLKPEVTPEKLEEMMRMTRAQLLRIPEVLSVKCGKRIDLNNEWPLFIGLDFENMETVGFYHDHPLYLKFLTAVINPNVADKMTLNFEMEPGKDVTYS
ncbi:MAG TPA: Dabb family protein [Chthoniobacterales bacterium]